MSPKHTTTINKEDYDSLKSIWRIGKSYSKTIVNLFDNYRIIISGLKLNLNDHHIQRQITLPEYLTEQGILRIVPYPSNLVKNGINSNNSLIINLLIVTKYGTLKITIKDYKVLLKSINDFSIKYNLRGLVNYVINNYDDLTFLDKETLKQYYETEIKIKEFEEIGNLVDTDSQEVQKI